MKSNLSRSRLILATALALCASVGACASAGGTGVAPDPTQRASGRPDALPRVLIQLDGPLRTDDGAARCKGPQLPLFVLDGAHLGDDGGCIVLAIAPDSFHSVAILRPPEAVERFGPEAAHGAVVVETLRRCPNGIPTDDRLPASASPSREVPDVLTGRSPEPLRPVTEPAMSVTRITPVSPAGRNPLFVLDGVVIPSDGREVGGEQIDPGEIVSVEVLKGAAAYARFGRCARDGVVLITSRRARSP